MAEIIEAAGRRWVLGLRWRNFESRPKTRELRAVGDELNMQWAAPRLGHSAPQAGFCKPIEGVQLGGLLRRNVWSIAAAIASTYEQPWLGIFKISDDRWYFIAVRDGYGIVPDGDVVGDRDTIIQAQARQEAYAGYNIREGSFYDDLVPVLKEARRDKSLAALQSLEPISPLRVIAPPAVGLALAVGGTALYERHEAAVRRAREARLAALHARELAAQRAVSPLKKTPRPDNWLAACSKAVLDLPLSVDSWTLKGLACVGDTARVSWKRSAGATVAAKPPGVITDNGNKVVQTIALVQLKPGPDDAAGLEKSKTALYALLQAIGVQARITASPAPRVMPGARAKRGAVPIPSAQVSFTLPIAPWELDFGKVPGLRLSDVDMVRNGWQVKGAIYGR